MFGLELLKDLIVFSEGEAAKCETIPVFGKNSFKWFMAFFRWFRCVI